jgi:hypothetical protein
MNLETTRLRGRPSNRWQDEVREVGRIVVRKVWKGRVYNRKEWKKLLRPARNRRIPHMPMELTNEYIIIIIVIIIITIINRGQFTRSFQ